MYQPCKLSISIYSNRSKVRICCRFVPFYDEVLAPCGLAAVQVALIQYIQRSDGTSIAELAARFGLVRSTLADQLRPLLHNDLLAIEPSRNDPSVKHLKLTEAGKRQLERAETLWTTAEAGFDAKLESRKASMLRGVAAAMAPSDVHAGESCNVAA